MISWFIQRPVGTSLFTISLGILGWINYNALPIASLPQIDFPTISVQASLPGASPEVMASNVALPLERQLGILPGVTEVTSTNTQGSTRIVVQFDLSRTAGGAATDVQSAINAAQSQLPADLPSMPTYRKINPAEAPILILALTTQTDSVAALYDIASTKFAQKISQINGVGQVVTTGSSLPGLRVELDPNLLNHYQINLEQIRALIAANNISRPKGFLQNDNYLTLIGTNDQIIHAKEYAELIVDFNHGSPIRLKDLGTIVDSIENIRNVSFSDGDLCVVLVIYKEPGANVVQAVAEIKKVLPSLEDLLPSTASMKIVTDRTLSTKASLTDVERTLFISIILVIAVIFIFLKQWRTTVIPALSIPFSLLTTALFMHFLGFSLNILSLMAMTIAVGFVIDDAVVVLENIVRHLEQGQPPKQAALHGTQEVAFTVISMTLSLIAVFIPILFMPGIVGRLFHEFAVTLAIALLVSMVLALAFIPMLASVFLKEEKKQVHIQSRFFQFYARTLPRVLDHPLITIVIFLLTVIATILLFISIPKGFLPIQDTGRIIGVIQAEQTSSFESLKEKIVDYAKQLKADPAIEHVTVVTGAELYRTVNQASLFIQLKPSAQRKEKSDDLIRKLKRSLHVPAGLNVYMTSAQDIAIGGRQTNAIYQYALMSADINLLREWEPKVIEALKKIPGITDLNSDQLQGGLQLYITIDKDKAYSLGIDTTAINQALYDAFGQRQVSTIFGSINQYHVVMEYDQQYTQYPEALNHVYIPTAQGIVPLSVFSSVELRPTPLAITHQSQFNTVTLSFNLAPGYALSTVTKNIQKVFDHLPFEKGMITARFQGSVQAFKELMTTELYLLGAALVCVYLILGVLYESYVHPITILTTLPPAGIGALLGLMMTGKDLSLTAFIGFILLIGIVKKNAIMMIDVALELKRNHHYTAKEAIYQACLIRYRPIMMTTAAALLSALVLALGTGMGAEIRQPLGISIVGGLMLSQILTLYTTPVLYLLMERLTSDNSENKLLLQRGLPSKKRIF